MVRALDLQLQRSWVQVLSEHFHVITLGKLFAHNGLCHQAA